MGIRDTNSKEFKATDNSVNSYSTLDHVVGENNGLCQKSYGYNFLIFTIMKMMMRCHGQQRFLEEKYTEEDLTKCRIKVFNLIFDVS